MKTSCPDKGAQIAWRRFDILFKRQEEILVQKFVWGAIERTKIERRK